MNESKKKIESEKDLLFIKKELEKRKKELEEQLAEHYKEQPPPDYAQDPGDQALSSTMETLRISLQDAELQEYHRIVQALNMIEAGTYGICIDCGQSISEKRLKLYPNVSRCLTCQEMLEEKRKEG